MMQNENLRSICFLITGLNFGGAESVVINLARNLKRRGWSVKVVSMLPLGNRAEDLCSSNIEVVSLNMRRGIPNPGAIIKLASILKQWRPIVLHTHMVHANMLGRVVRLVVSVPVLISTAHNINEGGKFREIAYRLSDYLTDLTTNVSRAGVERYLRIGAAKRNRIRYVPNGLDVKKFSPNIEFRESIRRELNIENEFIWLAVGSLEIQKDYPNMLQAFSLLTDSKNVRLLIVGQGPRREELIKLAQTLAIENSIRFLGVRKDIHKIMNAADVFIMSSSWEGMPMVLLEAAATGLPIVATDVGGNRDVVLDGKSGFLVSAKDPQELATIMRRVMSMSEIKRKEMGKAGRAYIEENFDIEHVVGMWERLYGEFIERNLQA